MLMIWFAAVFGMWLALWAPAERTGTHEQQEE